MGGGSGNTARDTLMLTGKCQKNQCLLGYGQPGWLGLEADVLLRSTHRRKLQREARAEDGASNLFCAEEKRPVAWGHC